MFAALCMESETGDTGPTQGDQASIARARPSRTRKRRRTRTVAADFVLRAARTPRGAGREADTHGPYL